MSRPGRFHPNYSKSRNRSSGVRGILLEDGNLNPAGGPSLPPLKSQGFPTDADWMALAWSGPLALSAAAATALPSSPGLYKLLDHVDGAVVYVGETSGLRSRLLQHARVLGQSFRVGFSVVSDAGLTLEYQRHELENDLIGDFYRQFRTSPRLQFGRDESSPADPYGTRTGLSAVGDCRAERSTGGRRAGRSHNIRAQQGSRRSWVLEGQPSHVLEPLFPQTHFRHPVLTGPLRRDNRP
jgi:hypothetical protein